VVTIIPLDSSRERVYLAPLRLWLTLDGGTFETLEMNRKTGIVRVGLSAASQYTPAAYLRVEQPATIQGVGKHHPAKKLAVERDSYVVPLGKQTTWIELVGQ
jgi:hypothetical protein